MRGLGGLAAALLGLIGCDSGSTYLGGDGPFMVSPRCTSGVTRNLNESEGPEMAPGRACNTCHAEENAASGEGDAPIFSFAGTVFPTGHEPDDCIGAGAAGALVVVTDSAGQTFTAAVNRGGNFVLEEDLFVRPYRAKLIFQGREREMASAQRNGDCNSCHTAAGTNGAPGRIVLP
jgi:hypothetical protein